MLSRLGCRPARPASRAWNVAKTFAQTVVFWTAFLLVFPLTIVALEELFGLSQWRFQHPAALWFGVLLFAVGGALGLTSGATMAIWGAGTPLPTDCPRELVVVGPYRYLRNPMALAGLGQGVAVGFILGSPFVVAYAIAGGPAWNYLVRPWEEADLERRFGEPFRRYRSEVCCWIPRLSPYCDSGASRPTRDEVPVA